MEMFARPGFAQKIALYFAAFLMLPFLVAVIMVASNLSDTLVHKQPEGLNQPLPPSPKIDPLKPVALIVLSNAGTQVREALSAAALVASSGKYQVLTVAPERVLSPTTSDLGILPDFKFADAPPANLLILPSVLDPQLPVMSNFVSNSANLAQEVVALGEGVRTLLPSGLLQGKHATIHFLALDEMKKSAPGVLWQNARVVRDGKFITSAGIAATSEAIGEALGGTPERTVEITPESTSSEALSLLPLFFHAAYDWDKPRLAIVVAPGVDETSLSQVLDLYPRTFSYKTVSVSPQREWVKTAHGLTVLAATSFDKVSQLDEIILPPSDSIQGIKDWTLKTGAETVSLTNHTDQEILSRIAVTRPEVSRASAFLIGAHWGAESDSHSKAFNYWLWMRPLLLGLLGIILMRLFLKFSENFPGMFRKAVTSARL